MEHTIFSYISMCFIAQQLIITFVKADIYYATPSSSIPCPEEDGPCFTLSQYATKPSNYFASTTTLILLPGNHSLNANLRISSINYLNITPIEASSSPAVINCEHLGRFELESIVVVYLTGLQFYECVDMTVTSVNYFTLTNCNYSNRIGIGLQLKLVPTGIFQNCRFISNTELIEISSIKELGGAIFLNQSGVHITDSLFDGNIAFNGGAIGAVDSNTTIDNGKFTNNMALFSTVWKRVIQFNSTDNETTFIDGGALYASNSNVVIRNSFFLSNAAVGDANNSAVSTGGAIYALQSGISLNNSSFLNNQADMGGAVIVTSSDFVAINNTFINNTAAQYYGGAMEVIRSNTTIMVAVYHHNTARKWGGALYVLSGNVEINSVDFRYNTAGEGSSALHLVGDEPLAIAHVNNLSVTDNVDNSSSTIALLSTTLISSGFVDIVSNSGRPNSVVISATKSTIRFTGITTIANNNGPSAFSQCNVTFEGHTNILNTLQGRGFQATLSNVNFNGTTSIMFNKASDYQCGGAIYAIESTISMHGVTTIAYNEAFCGGGIHAYQCEVNLKGMVYITGNRAEDKGGGIHAISTTTRHYGQSTNIVNNTATFGGGMCLELNAKLYILKEMECNPSSFPEQCSNTVPETWLRVEFVNNSAVYGGALYISDQSICTTIPIKEKTIASECFLQSFPTYVWRCESINVRNIFFNNNSAEFSGQRIFGGVLDRCSLSSSSEIFKKYYDEPADSLNAISYIANVTNLKGHEIRSKISSYPVRLCFCKDLKPDCSYQLPTMNVMKGETIRVPIVAVDQINNTVTNSTIQSVLSMQAGLREGQTVQNTNNGSCTDLKYNIISPLDHENLTLYAEGPCKNMEISLQRVQIMFLPCPVGFNDSGTTCECHPKLLEVIRNCSIDTKSVLRKGNVWIAVHNESRSTESFLTYRHCPFDYCRPSTETVWINLNEANGSDAQCAFSRTGRLCGSCPDGLSLSLGSSQCMPCSNEWLLLLITFAIAGIALVAILLVCNLTVAVGTINGLVFYANIIATNRSTFFPFTSPNVLTTFVSWLNLDLGFVTCFFDGLDGYKKAWLQLAFPLYIIFLVFFIICYGKHSKRFSRLISSKNPIATLATLLLLSYTKLLRTVIAALQFAILKYPDDSHQFLWLVDAQVRYFDSKHIPLFITAIIVLIIGLVYTFILLFWQCLQSCPYRIITRWARNHKLYSFMDAYHAPYNAKHRYWTGLLLLVRIVLYLVSAIGNIHGDPSVNLLCIICLVGVLQILSILVYKKWPLNCLESSFLLNCTLLSAATLYVRHSKGNQAAVAYTSTIIAFVTFLGILFYHTCVYVLPKKKGDQIHNKQFIGALGYQRLFDPKVEKRAELDENLTHPNVGDHSMCTHTVIEGRPRVKRQAEIEDFLKATEPLIKKSNC